ncbi:hypothetical protein KP509_14G068200 [Ceratopteris richardii]|uniref:AP2/ERF domain-containing protein n=1 Tax=Ceratopteris richardii TaxID=49495 RepID=A0A8T2TCU1_CERRI|nr:hypothetical protein KP509_14G068200 [Ceratopteris richardii]
MLDLNHSPLSPTGQPHTPLQKLFGNALLKSHASSDSRKDTPRSGPDDTGSAADAFRHCYLFAEEFSQKHKDMASTDYSSVTVCSAVNAKTCNDHQNLPIDCESSSNHAITIKECVSEHGCLCQRVVSFNDLQHPSDKGHHCGCILNATSNRLDKICKTANCNDQRPPSSQISKLTLEGDNSSGDRDALALPSIGSTISSTVDASEDNRCYFQHPKHLTASIVADEVDAITGVQKDCQMQKHREPRHDMVFDVQTKTRELFPLSPCLNRSEREDHPLYRAPNNVESIDIPSIPQINMVPRDYESTIPCRNFFRYKIGASTPYTLSSHGMVTKNLELLDASCALTPRRGIYSASTYHSNLRTMNHSSSSIVSGIQPAKKSRRGPRSRSSIYRGVTFYRRTGRWESHIWDCGKQVYLGGFDTAHAAARAYDRAAIRFRGTSADINFTLDDYKSEIRQMSNFSKEEFVHLLRRQSIGLSRGNSRFRGMKLNGSAIWEARRSTFSGKRVTNDMATFTTNNWEAAGSVKTALLDENLCEKSTVHEDRLELTLGGRLHHEGSLDNDETMCLTTSRSHVGSPLQTIEGPKLGSSVISVPLTSLNFQGQDRDHNQHANRLYENSKHPSKSSYKNTSLHLFEARTGARRIHLQRDLISDIKIFKSIKESLNSKQIVKGVDGGPDIYSSPPLSFTAPTFAESTGVRAWPFYQNTCVTSKFSSPPPASTLQQHEPQVRHVAAASSGFSPRNIEQQRQQQQQRGDEFPNLLHKTGFSYLPIPSLAEAAHKMYNGENSSAGMYLLLDQRAP